MALFGRCHNRRDVPIIKCAVKPLALAMGISGARRQAKWWVDPSQTVAI